MPIDSITMTVNFRQITSTITALVIREVETRFGRAFGGYAWAIIEPVLIVIVLGLIFNAYFGQPPLGSSFALFYSTGLVPYIVFSEIATQSSTSLVQNRPLLQLRPVSPSDTIIARFILSCVTLTVVSVIVFAAVLIYTESPSRIDLGPVLAGTSCAAIIGLGVGSANAVLFTFVPTWKHIWNIVNRPLFLISGIFFLHDTLPDNLRSILEWNPLIHAVSAVRTGFFDTYDPNWISLSYGFAFGLFCLVGGFSGLVVYRNRIVENL